MSTTPQNIHEQAAAILAKSSIISEEQPKPDIEDVETSETTEESEVETEEVETEQVETESEETDDDAEVVEEEQEGETEGDVLEVDPSVIASAFGISEKDLSVNGEGEVLIKVKVEGKTDYLPLEKIRRDYQLRVNTDNRASELKKERNAFDEEVAKRRQELDASFEYANDILLADEKALIEEYNSIDWDKEKAKDAALAALSRQEYSERLNYLRATRSKIDSDRQQLRADFAKEQTEKFKAYVEEEKEKILEVLPHWRNQKVAKKESAALEAYAIDLGFSEQEVENMVDHKSWLLIRKAWLYDQSQDKTAVAKKKVRAAPKVSKASAKPNREKIQKEKMEKQRTAARQGDTRQKTAFVSDLLKTG